MHRPSIALVCFLLLGGCGLLGGQEDAESIQLLVDRESYSPGDPITLTLVNGSNQEIGYNLCASTLQQQDDGSWSTVHPDPARVCTLELRILPARERTSYQTKIPTASETADPLAAGTYRFVTDIHSTGSGEPTSAATKPFTVE